MSGGGGGRGAWRSPNSELYDTLTQDMLWKQEAGTRRWRLTPKLRKMEKFSQIFSPFFRERSFLFVAKKVSCFFTENKWVNELSLYNGPLQGNSVGSTCCLGGLIKGQVGVSCLDSLNMHNAPPPLGILLNVSWCGERSAIPNHIAYTIIMQPNVRSSHVSMGSNVYEHTVSRALPLTSWAWRLVGQMRLQNISLPPPHSSRHGMLG